MFTQKQAYDKTTQFLIENIDKAYTTNVSSQIEKAAQEGKGDVRIGVDDMFDKKTDMSVKAKVARQLETLYKALGYRVEVEYGCSAIIIKWI